MKKTAKMSDVQQTNFMFVKKGNSRFQTSNTFCICFPEMFFMASCCLLDP